MENIIRRSAVKFKPEAVQTEIRHQYTVVLEYAGEGDGPYLVDLSHRMRWDLQDGDLAQFQPWGVTIPRSPNQCIFENEILINRMNRTQTSIWHLVGDNRLDQPNNLAHTETTDATIFLALFGNTVFSVTEKLTALDFLDPGNNVPMLFQGPFAHVPSQIVLLQKTAPHAGILLTCSRGYAQDMVDVILIAGEEYGLRPAGENQFRSWISLLSF